MRYPILSEVNPLEDDEVDRAEVEVQQCMELTATNRSRAWPEAEKSVERQVSAWFRFCICSFEGTMNEYSSLAQSVEHAAVNRSVVGSSPTGGATNPIIVQNN